MDKRFNNLWLHVGTHGSAAWCLSLAIQVSDPSLVCTSVFLFPFLGTLINFDFEIGGYCNIFLLSFMSPFFRTLLSLYLKRISWGPTFKNWKSGSDRKCPKNRLGLVNLETRMSFDNFESAKEINKEVQWSVYAIFFFHIAHRQPVLLHPTISRFKILQSFELGASHLGVYAIIIELQLGTTCLCYILTVAKIFSLPLNHKKH